MKRNLYFSLFLSLLIIRSFPAASQFSGSDPISDYLPGQVIPDPYNPNKLAYYKDENNDGQLDPFFLCGLGDPEGFLYRGKRNKDGTRSGDQQEIIQNLKDHGGNCIYLMAVRTHGGDARKSKQDEPEIYPDDYHNPWLGQDPKNGLNMDLLNQWEDWFVEMEKNNILIYFFIYDDAIKVEDQFGWGLNEEGELHANEKKFVQELVNRFKHHPNLIWCIMEEGQEIGKDWQQHISKIAEAIREVDDHKHIIAGHQLGGNVFFHKNDPVIRQFAIQTHVDYVATPNELHNWLLKAHEVPMGNYSLVVAEDYYHGNITVPNGDRKETRLRSWASAMAGTYVMIYGLTGVNAPPSWLQDCKAIQGFFESTNFNELSPNDSLSYGETSFVLSNTGFDYILYSSNSTESLGLKNLEEGIYNLTWFDILTMETRVLDNISVGPLSNHTWTKPQEFGEEVVLYINRVDRRPERNQTYIQSDSQVLSGSTENIPPTVEDIILNIERNTIHNIQLRFVDTDGGPGRALMRSL